MFDRSGSSKVAFPCPVDGTLLNLFVNPAELPNSNGILTITVLVDGVETALSVTHHWTEGSSVKSNTTARVQISQGQLILVKFTESGGFQTFTEFHVTFQLK